MLATLICLTASLTVTPNTPVIDAPVKVITLNDPSKLDRFGQDILATDDYLLVLAPINNSTDPGRYHVFKNDTLEWVRKIAPNDIDRLGSEPPTIKNDHELLVVAYPERQVTVHRVSTNQQIGTIDLPEGRDLWRFGEHMAMDAQTNRLVITASSASGRNGRLASSFIALYDLTNYKRVAELTVPNINARLLQLGRRVCMQGDLIIVGTATAHDLNAFQKSLLDEDGLQQAGMYLFESNTGKFLKKFDGEHDESDASFGRAILANERYLIVAGASTIYVYDRKTFALHGKIETEIIPGQRPFDEVSLTLDGDLMAVGVNGTHPVKGNGCVNIYSLGDLSLRYNIMPKDLKVDDRFGSAGVEIKNNRLYVGATGDDRAGKTSGAVYIFDLPMP